MKYGGKHLLHIIKQKHPHLFANNSFRHQHLGEVDPRLFKCAQISQNYLEPVLLAEGWKVKAGPAR